MQSKQESKTKSKMKGDCMRAAFSYFKEDYQQAFAPLEGRQSAFSYFENEDDVEACNGCKIDLEKRSEGGKNIEKLKPHFKKEEISPNVEREGMMLEGTNFGLKLIAKRIVIDVSDVKKILYRFQISLYNKEVCAEVGVEDLYKFLWIQKATHGRAFMGATTNATDLKLYIHKVLEKDYECIPTEYYYKQNGWIKLSDGRLGYVCEHGIVGKPTNKITGGADLKFQINLNDVGTKRNFIQFYDMQKISHNINFSRVLMTFSSLSVLTSLFELAGFPIKFIVGVLGTTNSMKTSTAMVFSNVFNALENKNPEVTFSSTQSGIETMVSRYSDSILLVDDFMPMENKKKQYEQNAKLELLCRLYGDRASKKRMMDFAQKKVEYPVKGCCLFTGEILTGVESSRSRILVLKLEKGDIDKGALSFYQENPLVLPTYLYGFIQFIEKNIDETLKLISERVPLYRTNSKYSIERLNEVQAIFFTMIDIMVWYWRYEGYISNQNIISDEWRESVQLIIEENARQLSVHSMPEIILSALQEMIYTEPARVKNVQEIEPMDVGRVYYDNNFLYVRANDLYLMVKEFCQKYDYAMYLDKGMIVGKLKEADVLETIIDENGNIQASRKLKQGRGVKKRFLYIRRKKFLEIVEK